MFGINAKRAALLLQQMWRWHVLTKFKLEIGSTG